MQPAQPTEVLLLSTRNAARYLDVSNATLFRLARRGLLNPVRLGPYFTRWPKADLDAYVTRAAEGSAA